MVPKFIIRCNLSPLKNYYQVLHVPPDASPDEIKHSYLTLVKLYHPDRFNSTTQRAEHRKATELIQELIQAYEVLSNPRARNSYDSELLGQSIPKPRPDDSQKSTKTEEHGTKQPRPTEPPKPPPSPSAEKTAGNRSGSSSFRTTVSTNSGLSPFALVALAGIIIATASSFSSPTPTVTPSGTLGQSNNQSSEAFLKLLNTRPEDLWPELDKLASQRKKFPIHGTTQFFTDEERLARLKIDTPNGSNYLIRLKDIDSGKKIATIYIQGGQPYSAKVPLGNYVMVYASGTEWYGNKLKFGPEMVTNKFDSVMSFRIDGTKIVGKSVSFYDIPGGNLSSTRIRPEELD